MKEQVVTRRKQKVRLISKLYSPTSKPFAASPCGARGKRQRCSLASRCRTQPLNPVLTGSRSRPVVFPGPPTNNGSRNVILANKPCNQIQNNLVHAAVESRCIIRVLPPDDLSATTWFVCSYEFRVPALPLSVLPLVQFYCRFWLIFADETFFLV